MSPDTDRPTPVPNTSMLPHPDGDAPQGWHTSQNVRDEWPATLRRAVRSKPLAALAAAVVFGMLFARLRR